MRAWATHLDGVRGELKLGDVRGGQDAHQVLRDGLAGQGQPTWGHQRRGSTE